MRITKNILKERVETLNKCTGDDCFFLSMANGGYSVRREGEDVLHCGHIPAKDCYNRLNCFMHGYIFGKEQR